MGSHLNTPSLDSQSVWLMGETTAGGFPQDPSVLTEFKPGIMLSVGAMKRAWKTPRSWEASRLRGSNFRCLYHNLFPFNSHKTPGVVRASVSLALSPFQSGAWSQGSISRCVRWQLQSLVESLALSHPPCPGALQPL